MTLVASLASERYPRRLQAWGVLRQGGVTGIILVGRSDLLGFHERYTHVNPRGRFLRIKISLGRVGWRAECSSGGPKTIN